MSTLFFPPNPNEGDTFTAENGVVYTYVNGNYPDGIWQGANGNLLNVTTDVIPSSNISQSLGNATNQWQDLWVSGNTIYIGSVPLTIDNGTLQVDGANVVSNTGDITFTNANISTIITEPIQIQPLHSVLAGTNGPNLYLQAGDYAYTNSQVLAEGGALHLQGGNASIFQYGVGTAVGNVGGAGGPVVITSTSLNRFSGTRILNNWTFDNLGNLTLPDLPSPSINYANGQPYGGSGGNVSSLANSTARFTLLSDNSLLSGTVASPQNFTVNSVLTPDIDLRNTSGTGSFTQGANLTVRTAGSYNWLFGADGNLTLPGAINTNLIVGDSAVGQVVVIANSAVSSDYWEFRTHPSGDPDGSILNTLHVPPSDGANISAIHFSGSGGGAYLGWYNYNSWANSLTLISTNTVSITTEAQGGIPGETQWLFDTVGNLILPALTGTPQTISLTTGGVGYTTADDVPTDSGPYGNGHGMTLNIVADTGNSNAVLSATINNPGQGYHNGAVITIDQPSSTGTATVTVNAVANGSPSINYANGQPYGGSGGGTPVGPNYSLQFNDGGAFNGTSNITTTGTDLYVTANIVTQTLTAPVQTFGGQPGHNLFVQAGYYDYGDIAAQGGTLYLQSGNALSGSAGDVVVGAGYANWTYTSGGAIALPMTAKLNSGGIGNTNAAEFGTEVYSNGTAIYSSQIYMGAGTTEIRGIVGNNGAGLMYAGVEGAGFAGTVGMDPDVTSQYAIAVGPGNTILLGAATGNGELTTTEYTAGVGALNANGTINGLLASSSNVVISNGNTAGWDFGVDGMLTLPGGGTITSALGSPEEGLWLGWNGHRLLLNNDGQFWTGGIELGGNASPGYIGSYGNITLNADIGTGPLEKQWVFGTDGNLTAPGNINFTNNAAIQLNPVTGVTIYGNSIDQATALNLDNSGNASLYANGNVTINSNSQDSNPQWIFDTSGNLTVPGNLNAVTASPAPSINGFDTINAINFSASGNVTASNFITGGSGGNITGANVISANSFITPNTTIDSGVSTTGSVVALNIIQSGIGNVNGYNAYFANNVTVQGVVQASSFIAPEGNGTFIGNIISGDGALYAGVPGYTPLGSNVVVQFAANVNNYSQINFQNISNGSAASTDYILTADNGNDTTYYADLGINGSAHADPDFFGDTTSINDVYLYAVGPGNYISTDSGPGNLILGSADGLIKMFVGNTAQANVIQQVTSTGVEVFGNVNATGNIIAGNITSGNISTGVITLTNGAMIQNTAGNAVVFGLEAGNIGQGTYAVAIGAFAGQSNQGNQAVAIGGSAGATNQGVYAVAIGAAAGAAGNSAVAIGVSSGFSNQGDFAVAIGASAGTNNQGNNSIILNATGIALNQTTANTFTVAPVRNDVANIAEVMFYNTTSKEITYGNTISVAGDITSALRVVTTPTALANLTAVAGGRAFVNDGNLVAVGNFGSQIGTGGSNVVPVWSDGSNWYIG
jgi:hypothetical protein